MCKSTLVEISEDIGMNFWNILLRLGTWGRNFEGDFIAGSIAFLISFLISWAT
jgi:hypothetical protein